MMNQSSTILQPPHQIYVAVSHLSTDSSPSRSSQSSAETAYCSAVRMPRGQVKVPMRLVESPHYSDAALSVYMKVKALAQRREGCTAGVATLARYLGFSASTVQRGLAQLRAPAPDGVVELPLSTRRSLPGGRGTTACRRVRPMQRTEPFIWLPVAASEHLRPRLLRAYAVIAHAVVQKIPLAERDLADFLRHHSGPRAGEAISTEAASRIVDELVASGWIGVLRRAGFQGRHEFVVNDQPTCATPVLDDPSGHDVDARSLAYREDLSIDRLEIDAALVSSAVGEVPVDKRVGAPREKPGPDRTPDGLALRADEKRPAPAPAPVRKEPPYSGPPLTFSGRLHVVLEPVRFLLADVNTYVQRRIGQEIARQLGDGMTVARLRDRLRQRLAQTVLADIRDVGRWLLGVALPRWGCANPDCETGVLCSTGARCPVCREVVAQRAAARRGGAPLPGGEAAEGTDRPSVPRAVAPASPPAPPAPRTVTCCPSCERPHRPGHSGLCRDCRPGPGPAPALRVGDGPCSESNGTCGHPSPHGLCWRCRIASDARRGGAPTPAPPAATNTGRRA
ncbi:hypothetical protein ACFY1J_37950 [Streptomyces sp. NPDC001406]|uniref:hypothetical protein n=1 Tax=Streptomyces sp. NPDC001406 TaxID=3364572 RepID=UPI003696A969